MFGLETPPPGGHLGGKAKYAVGHLFAVAGRIMQLWTALYKVRMN